MTGTIRAGVTIGLRGLYLCWRIREESFTFKDNRNQSVSPLDNVNIRGPQTLSHDISVLDVTRDSDELRWRQKEKEREMELFLCCTTCCGNLCKSCSG